MTTQPTRSRLVRWLRRIGLGLVILLLGLTMLGTAWEAISWRRTVAQYPPPGQMVDIGGRKLHILCRGTGQPTVILEAGLDLGGIVGWSLVQDSIAATTRTCAYNRAGIIWSDPAPAPHNAATVAADLHALLAAAGEKAPFVLVGHSLGGPYIMAYTKRYPADVAGLVFVDASHPDQVKRLTAVIGKPPEAKAMMAVMRVTASLAWTGLARAVISPRMDMPKVPRDRVAAMRAYAPRSLGQMLLEQQEIDSTFADAGSFRDLGNRPVVVLTAMKPVDSTARKTIGITAEQAVKFQDEWRKMHDEEASWSTTSRHELVPDASHYIQIDRPDVVIRAVREVVDSVRAREAAPAPASGPARDK